MTKPRIAPKPPAPVPHALCKGSCSWCQKDQRFLMASTRPTAASGPKLRAVDLFAGCGGMSLGLEEAARRAGLVFQVPLAIDFDKAVVAVYERNFPKATVETGDIASLLDGQIGARKTATESKLTKRIGAVDVLLGGPPCQGHSDLNNHTRRRDPKNALYLCMARAAEILEPRLVVIENVPAVQWDQSGVVERTVKALQGSGYTVTNRVLDLRRVGVPQRRRRHLVIASKIATLDPQKMLDELSVEAHPDRTVRWAIHDLEDAKSSKIFDTPSRPNAENVKRMAYLFNHHMFDLPDTERPECHRNGGHSYVSMYGRLAWDEAAQTITTGFGSMGQGRYVHPARRRTITPHEAARLQTFPDWFDFGDDTPRGVLAKIIGNAVPPLLMVSLGAKVIPHLEPSPET